MPGEAVSDEAILEAVAAEAGWMEDLMPPAAEALWTHPPFLAVREGEGIHGIDERVSLRSVVESAQVLGLFIRDWCGLVPGRKEES